MSHLQTGERLDGRFEVHRLIGTGDLSEVYEVWDQSTGKLAAAKLITYPGVGDPVLGQIEQLASQAAQASQLFVPMLARGTSLQGPYLVREFVQLASLARVVDRTTRLPLPTVTQLVDQLAKALDAVHASGIAHGDLQPANVFVPALGDTAPPRVTDFGTSVLRVAAPSPWPGIPGWISPEQAQSGVATTAGDIYALTALAFYALLGTQFFRHARGPDPDVTQLWQEMYGVTNDAVARAAEEGIALPAEFDEVFGQGLSSQPQQRYARASEFAQAFREAAANARKAAAAAPKPPKPVFEGTMVVPSDAAAAAGFLPAAGSPFPAAGPRPAAGTPRPAAGAPPPAAVSTAGDRFEAAGGGGEPPMVSPPPIVSSSPGPALVPPAMVDDDEMQTAIFQAPAEPSAAPDTSQSGDRVDGRTITRRAPAGGTSQGASPAPAAGTPAHADQTRSSTALPGTGELPGAGSIDNTIYADAPLDMPRATDDKPEVVLRSNEPLFGKRQILLMIAAAVLVLLVFGSLGTWLLMKMDKPVDFPTAPSAQPK